MLWGRHWLCRYPLPESLPREAIAYATHRDQALGIAWILLHLPSQASHVGGDKVRRTIVVIAPDGGKQLVMRQRSASIGHQVVQQPKLDGSEVHLTPVGENGYVVHWIEVNAAHGQLAQPIPEGETAAGTVGGEAIGPATV